MRHRSLFRQVIVKKEDPKCSHSEHLAALNTTAGTRTSFTFLLKHFSVF